MGVTARTKKYRKPSQRNPTTMCVHRKAICSMLVGLAANVTSSLQKTNENDHIGYSIKLPMVPPFPRG